MTSSATSAMGGSESETDQTMNDQRNIRQFLSIRDYLINALSVQQAKRSQYAGTTWIAAERDLMLRETNECRKGLDKSPLAIEQIMRVERMALGHSDYPKKFALYCAELVLDCGMTGDMRSQP